MCTVHCALCNVQCAMCRALRTYEAAKAKGDDGRPDFAARKECNYLVSVLQVLQHTPAGTPV